MTDAGQQDLSSWAKSGGDARPAAEAEYVAGADDGAEDVVDPMVETLPDADGTVDFRVMQVDYTIEGTGSDEHPIVHVFGRTSEGAREHVRVRGFQPYFYVPVDSVDPSAFASHDGIVDYQEGYESIRGDDLLKVFGRTPRDVGQVRDEFDHYEADVLFPNRLLIDKGIESGIRVPARRENGGDGEGRTVGGEAGEGGGNGESSRAPITIHHAEIEPVDVVAEPRVHTLDIEVDDRHGFPEDGEEPIVCLTTHDSVRDEYVGWIFPGEDAEWSGDVGDLDYDPITDDAAIEIRAFESEAAMLDSYLEYVGATDPDVLTGWNFDDFDMPYVLDRLEELDGRFDVDADLSIERLSRVDEVWRSNWGAPDVKGRVVFDLLYAYQRTQFSELDSYRLDAVAEEELGVGKERYTGDIGDLWEQDPERLLEYNVRDVELCVELDRKQDVIAFWDEVRTFVGCKLEDATTPGDAVDMYVLHKVNGEFVLPSKGQQESEDYEGGAVFDPITGVREMVSVLDLKSLYPMCMVTTNASPETKVDPDRYGGETFVAPNGTHFRKEPDGIIREMVDELLSERDQKKELRNQHDPDSSEYDQFDQQQAAVKVIMNCFTPDTDVLTPGGVRNVRDLGVGDEVYSLDPDTQELQVKPVSETHTYPEYRDDLVDIETSKIDLRVTPNHRMLVRKNETNGITEDGYSFVEAGDLDRATNYELPHDWDGPGGEELEAVDLTEFADEYEVWVRPDVHGHTFAAEIGYYPDKVLKNDVGREGYVFDPEALETHRAYLEDVAERTYIHQQSGRKWIPRVFDGDDFLQLLAWYITEGNVYTPDEKEFGDKFRGSATTVKIAQNAVAADGGDDHHGTIGDLLDRMEFDYYVDDRSYHLTSKLLGELLRDLGGDGSEWKRIPAFVYECSRRQKRLFLDTLLDADGDRQPNSWRYTTSSEQLRDDVLRLATHLGLTVSYGRDSGSWRIYCNETSKNTLRMHRSGSRSTAEDGVYCVTVEDNHTILAGRNGTFQFVGQSLYGVLGWERFRLYDKEMGAAVTATGREVIEHTEQAANELDKEVIYGDTDSVMLELGGDVPIDEAIGRSFEIEEHINDSYDEFAHEELNAHVHRFEIEFEKLYRRFFQAGKKKRYAGHIVWKEGKEVDDVDITGFEYQRSDIAPITKEVQLEVIDMIVRGEDIDDVTDYVHECIEEFKSGNADPAEIGIPGGIGKRLDNYDTDTAQVRGAKFANMLLGTNFDRGSKPKRLYLEDVHPEFFRRMENERGFNPQEDDMYLQFKRDVEAGDGVICIEYADQLPDEFEIDWEKMLDKTLKGPIERILEALDVSWEEVESGQEQTGLSGFM